MPEYLAPGVYIDELTTLPPSIQAVPTENCVFIGYTERHSNHGQSLLLRPQHLTSLLEYEEYFGQDAPHQFALQSCRAGQVGDIRFAQQDYQLRQVSANFLLYRSLRLFFSNGGSECYVVSVGDYANTPKAADLINALQVARSAKKATICAIPDAVALANALDCASVQQALVQHCAVWPHPCFAVLDIFAGDTALRSGSQHDCVDAFRQNLQASDLSYAAAYYPWLDTNIVAQNSVSLAVVQNLSTVKKLLSLELSQRFPAPTKRELLQYKQIRALIDAISLEDLGSLSPSELVAQQQLHQSLLRVSPGYASLINNVVTKLSVLPPSGAICGVFTLTDTQRGVWKAPANTALAAVIKPCQALNDEQQRELNVDLGGKSVNAIRSFAGQGVLVWGARTLASNSEYRYVNVRRTLMMVQQSICDGLDSVVFEPNDEPLWVKVRMMIENFLTLLWREGALAGAKPEQAFFVQVGLNVTMTQHDIQAGRLLVDVGLAISRPAEFTLLRLEKTTKT
jgi:uncharacterized protein